MKKQYRFLFVGACLLLASFVRAQTNTFPSSGNVGIGTTSPAEKLVVVGNLLVGAETGGGKNITVTGNADAYINLIADNNDTGEVDNAWIYFSQDGGLVTGYAGLTGNADAAPDSAVAYEGALNNAFLFGTHTNNPVQLGTYAQARLTINQNGLIGIGTNAPSARLTVGANTPIDEVVVIQSQGLSGLEVHGDTANISGEPGGAYVLVTQDGGGVGGIIGTTQKAGKEPRGGAYANVLANALIVGTLNNYPLQLGTYAAAHVTITSTGNVGVGTASPGHKLTVNGAIRAKEVIVDAGWADYVFASDYRLAPLSEVEAHIKEKGHLPDIPSAQEIAEHGVSVGESQALLLRKIEELTLHLIAQEKEMAQLRSEITRLAKESADGRMNP